MSLGCGSSASAANCGGLRVVMVSCSLRFRGSLLLGLFEYGERQKSMMLHVRNKVRKTACWEGLVL